MNNNLSRVQKCSIGIRRLLLALLVSVPILSMTQAETELSARDIAQNIRPAIVQIGLEVEVNNRFWSDDAWSSSGSGFIFHEDEDGDFWVLTNSHVLGFDEILEDRESAPKLNSYDVSVTMFDDVEAEILHVLEHEELDAAILIVRAEGLSYQALNEAKEAVEVGEQVYAMGYALGGPLYFTRGIVSIVDNEEGEIGTDAAINFGNSGGPLVNDRGQVVGMNTYGLDGSEGMGFAIQIDRLLDLQRYVEFDFLDPTAIQRHLDSLYFEVE